MGKLETGILGKSTGKIGPVITANWKSLNVVKQYFRPSNPRTPDQQLQRNRFTQAVFLTRSVLTTIVKPIWDNLSIVMSGYNLFVQSLLNSMDNNNHPTTSTLISKGTLLSSEITEATYSGDELNINFINNSGQGNAKDNDLVGILVYDKSSKQFVFTDIGVSTRSDGSASAHIGSQFLDSNLIVWIFFKQENESGSIYSDSVGSTVRKP